MPSSLEASSALGPARAGWTTGLLASLRENSPLLILVLLYWLAADELAALVGAPHRALDQAGDSYIGYAAICFAAFSIAFVIWILRVTLVRKVSIQTPAFWRLVVT